jgi:2-keto-3-deoxy-L-rhamnonate aldolase RhmA
MRATRAIAAAVAVTLVVATSEGVAQQPQGRGGGAQGAAPAAPALYNTVKQKLKEGKQVVGGTVLLSDPDVYCAMANAGFDFTWIEMQHAPLTYQDVARMIAACKGAPAIPFIRVPDATEGDLQKAMDIGALGIMIPMVDTVEKAQNAVKFAKYPPLGRRSQGSGQYGALWGRGYRQTANDNVLIIAMIENPAGVEMADAIAAVPGIDGLFVAATDLGSFTGLRQGDAKYEALVTRVFDVAQKRGIVLGGPSAWKDTRKGFTFFQGPDEMSLLRSGAGAALGGQPAVGTPRGVAPIEGAER